MASLKPVQTNTYEAGCSRSSAVTRCFSPPPLDLQMFLIKVLSSCPTPFLSPPSPALRNPSPIPHFMTSLIQACKILTAATLSPQILPPPFCLAGLPSSSFHSILAAAPSASHIPCLRARRRLKCEVSINPDGCKSFRLLRLLPRAR